MNRRTVAWALVLTAVGLVVAFGWFPGAATASLGPRVGLATACLVFGAVLGIGAFTSVIRARSERLDRNGGCPVGASCACGHFNFKPRATCRQCGEPTRYA